MKLRNTFATLLAAAALLPLFAAEVTWLRQDFESPEVQAQPAGRLDGDIGQWSGVAAPALTLADNFEGREGRCVVVKRIANYAGMDLRSTKGAIPAGHNYRLGATFHLDPSQNTFILLLTGKEEWVLGVGLYSGAGLKTWSEAKVWNSTGTKVPAGWFRVEIEVDVLQGTYTPIIITPDGEVLRDDAWPLTSNGAPEFIRIGNSMPVGNHSAVDDVFLVHDEYSATAGRQELAANATRRTLEDGTIEVELAGIAEASTLHLADVAGSSAVTISGFNAMGQWQTLAAKCQPDADGVIHADFKPARISKLRIEGASGLGALALYETAGVSTHAADKNFQARVHGEFYLPVYGTEACADLHLFNTTQDTIGTSVLLTDRVSGAEIQPARKALLVPGENVVNFPLAGLADGEYVAEVRQIDGERGSLRRLLRFQSYEEPRCTTVPDMRGKRLYFPDNYYFQESRNIATRAAVAKTYNATKRTRMESLENFFQEGSTLFVEDGRLNLVYHTMDNFFHTSTNKFFRISAPLEDLDNWSTPEPVDEAFLKSHRCGNALAQHVIDSDWAPKPGPDGKIRYRLYDPATDGQPDVRQLNCYYVPWMPAGTQGGADLPDWEGVTPVRRSTWVIWHKEPGLSLIMTKEPLLVDGSSGQEFEGEQDSNDNFAGQWLSDDGKTLFYARGHIVKRYPPYNVPYDNGNAISRVLTIYSTQDGIHFQRKTMARQQGDFPPGTQHYGASIFRMKGGDGLRAAFVMKYQARDQRNCLELATSRDGMNWKTFHNQPITVDNGPKGDWLAGGASFSPCILNANGKSIALMGWNCTAYHLFSELIWDREDFGTITPSFVENYYKNRQIETWPLFKEFSGWEEIAAYIQNTCINVGVMEYRQDGLFYAESDDGDFTTVPFRAAGECLLNGETTGDYGRIAVELLQNGESIQTALFQGDDLAYQLFCGLPDGEYQLRVRLKGAKLYTIEFR